MDIGKISSAGLGSGLDVSGIVTQLMALERRPLELLDSSKTKLCLLYTSDAADE